MLVTIGGTKGGVGKTTTTVALAVEAAAQGIDVGIIDTDPQSSAAQWIRDLCVCLPGVEDASALRRAADHDLVLIDVPPGAAPQAIAALEAADVVVAVTGLGPADIMGLTHFLSLVDPHHILPTRIDRRRSLHAMAMEVLRSRYGKLVADPIPASASIEWAQADEAPLPALSPPAIAYRALLERILNEGL